MFAVGEINNESAEVMDAVAADARASECGYGSGVISESFSVEAGVLPIVENDIGEMVSRGEIIEECAEKSGLACSKDCLLYTSPSPRDLSTSRMPSSA